MKQEIRYDELRAGDVIEWHGAKEIVEWTEDQGESEHNPGEKVIRFKLMPYDKEAVEMLGKFYANGIYGGVGFLTTELIQRGIIA